MSILYASSIVGLYLNDLNWVECKTVGGTRPSFWKDQLSLSFSQFPLPFYRIPSLHLPLPTTSPLPPLPFPIPTLCTTLLPPPFPPMLCP